MIEKKNKLGIKRDDGFLYTTQQDGVWRTPATKDGEGDLVAVDGATPERVCDLGFEMDEFHFYFVDEDGDVSQVRSIPIAQSVGARRLAALPNPAPSRIVTPTPARFWLFSDGDQFVDQSHVPDEAETWAFPFAIDEIRPGDGVFLWLVKPHQCIVGLQEVVSVETAEDGTVRVVTRFLTHTLEAPQYRDELLDEAALAHASFLSAKFGDNLTLLTAVEAQQLAASVGRSNPVVAPIVDVWLAQLDKLVAIEPPAPIPPAEPTEGGGFIEADTVEAGVEYRVLSIQPPWAWSVIFAGKDVENRSWTTPYRGTILIHASSKKFTGKALEEARRSIAERAGIELAKVPKEFPRSQMLGFVDLVDCVANSRSPWAFRGEEHWILRRPRPLLQPVLNIDGKLNLWRWSVDQPMSDNSAVAEEPAAKATPAPVDERPPSYTTDDLLHLIGSADYTKPRREPAEMTLSEGRDMFAEARTDGPPTTAPASHARPAPLSVTAPLVEIVGDKQTSEEVEAKPAISVPAVGRPPLTHCYCGVAVGNFIADADATYRRCPECESRYPVARLAK